MTLCHVVESVLCQYCGWHSRAGVVIYLKFREPYTVEPAACRQSNKTGMLVIDKKSYAVQEGSVLHRLHWLDLGHICQVGTQSHRCVVLDCQVTQMHGGVSQAGVGKGEWGFWEDLHIRSHCSRDDQKWRTIQTGLMGLMWGLPHQHRAVIPGQHQGTHQHQHVISRGASYCGGNEKDQVAGLELTEIFLLCGFFRLKVHKIKNFFDSDFGICVISLLVMSKY